MPTQITEEMVYQELAKVMDPELHIDIVSLGLIYEVKLKTNSEGTEVMIVMTLTTPGCPLAPVIDKMIKKAVGKLGISPESITTKLVWEPPWTKERMSEEAKLKLGIFE